MPHSRTFAIALLGVSALLASAPALALNPTFYQSVANASETGPDFAPSQSVNSSTAGPASYQLVSGGNTASSTTESAFGGSVFSTATGTSRVVDGVVYQGGAGAITTIGYYPILTGGVPGSFASSIPVRVQASGYVDGIPFGFATALFSIRYDDGSHISLQTLIARAQIDASGAGTRSFALDQIINIRPNTEISVGLRAEAYAGGPTKGIGSSWAKAFVDPTFTIDPAYAADYHFEGIPGVPEPMSAALLVAGLAVIGVSRRRNAKA
jgi:hypothetical protein